MCSIALETPIVTIHWYGVMIALAFLVGIANCMLVSRWRDRREDAVSYMSDLGCWIMICAIVGSRIAYVLSDLPHYAANPVEILHVHKGGVVFYGGFVGGCLGIWLFAIIKKDRVLRLWDVVTVGVPLAHAFGRFGCFLNGCCYGILCKSPLGVSYPDGSPVAFDHFEKGHVARGATSLSVHPVQLYEAGLNILLYAFLMWFYPRKKHDGTVAATYLLGYPIIRFSMEFLRGDRRLMVGPLTVAQASSVGLFTIASVYWILVIVREKRKAAGRTQ